uniref:Type II secretion system protein GspG C-terminal domain-containing protein n=1 Tax=candidate division WWE3 bacterium TaxID=2053526 RepID=A0A831YYR2_UNCKA
MELLLSVGLLLILAAVAFWAIDPIERQRQERDQRRLEDLESLWQAIEAEIAAGNPLGSTFGVPSGTAGVEVSFNPDGSGWIPMNLARYFPSLPADPRNDTTFTDFLGSKILGEYQFISDGRNYVLRTHLEAEANRDKYAQDGNDNTWYEVGTAPGMSTYFGL